MKPHTTPSPIIVVPTKFEDIFAKPLVIVDGDDVNNVMTTDEFNKKALKDGSALDRARERMRNQMNNPAFEQIIKSMNPSLISTTLPPNNRKKTRPVPFSRIPNSDDMKTQSTTLSSLRSSTFSTRAPTTKRPPLPPMPTLKFHFFNNSVTSTTPHPNRRPPTGTTANFRRPQSFTTTRKPSPTLVTTISSVVTKTFDNVKDKMKAARNKLRALMGAQPIGTTPKPRGNTQTKIQKQREKILAMMEKQKEEEIKAAAIAAGHVVDEVIELNTPVTTQKNPIPLNFPSSSQVGSFKKGNEGFKQKLINPFQTTSIKPEILTDHRITIASKSNFGQFDPMNIKRQKLKEKLNEELTTRAPSKKKNIALNHPNPTSNVVKILDEQTESGMKINVMDVPSRMQETLRKLLRQKGLKKKPFQRLAKKPIAVVDPKKEFADFRPPSSKQDTLLRPLQGNKNGVAKGLKTPSFKQDTLLRPLIPSHDEKIGGLKHPSTKQDTLLNKLQPGHTSQIPGLIVPHKKQDTLLRNLKSNNHGKVQNLRAPSTKQNTLLRNLKSSDIGHVENLNIPPEKQNTLLRNLKDNDVGFVENIRVPHNKQNTLLRNLSPNDHGRVVNMHPPSKKQDTLLRPLVGNDDGRHQGLQTPLKNNQTPGLNINSNIKNLKPPPKKQDLKLLKKLREDFRKLKEEKTDRTLNLLLPKRNRRPQKSNFNPNILSTPSKRQNPLLRILKFDQRERKLRKGLSPPNFKQNSFFQQVVKTPQKYHKDFLQLPEKDQTKLLAILNRYGGDDFDANAILSPPPPPGKSNTGVPSQKEPERFRPSQPLSNQRGRKPNKNRNRGTRPTNVPSQRPTPNRANVLRKLPSENPTKLRDKEKSLDKGKKNFLIFKTFKVFII